MRNVFHRYMAYLAGQLNVMLGKRFFFLVSWRHPVFLVSWRRGLRQETKIIKYRRFFCLVSWRWGLRQETNIKKQTKFVCFGFLAPGPRRQETKIKKNRSLFVFGFLAPGPPPGDQIPSRRVAEAPRGSAPILCDVY